jgi:hypothetical protein
MMGAPLTLVLADGVGGGVCAVGGADGGFSVLALGETEGCGPGFFTDEAGSTGALADGTAVVVGATAAVDGVALGGDVGLCALALATDTLAAAGSGFGPEGPRARRTPMPTMARARTDAPATPAYVA